MHGMVVRKRRCLAATTLDFRAAAQASAEQSATKQQATASSPDDKSGPNYADTVHYIQQKIGDAGYPTPGGKLYGVVGNSPGVADTFNYDDAKYTFDTDGCQSMTATSTDRRPDVPDYAPTQTGRGTTKMARW